MSTTTTLNGLDVDRLSGTMDAVTANPGLARFQFRARHEWIDGSYSRTTIKDFYGVGQEDASRTAPFTVAMCALGTSRSGSRSKSPATSMTISSPSSPAS